MSELVGTQINQYHIADHIADGGMATVYRAYQPSMERDVAIKVLPSQFTKDKDFIERFNIEVRTIAQLQHPHILPVYDYGTHDNSPYIVMAYLNGGSLADKLADGACSVETTLRICKQVAEALDFAHSKGIVHRDFKPGNVLLDEQGNAYLADFGLAKILKSEANITAMNIIGTPAYMAPEQAKGEDITGSADVYALGATVYEMLTGDIPYTGTTATSIILSHIQDPIPDIRMSRLDLPEEIQDVFERVLAKEPDDRYQKASEFLTQVETVFRSTSASDSDILSQTPVPQPALLMTNMVGRVIFVDNPCLNLLRYHQHDVRNIMGQTLDQVLGVDASVTKSLMDSIRSQGNVENLALEVQDSRGVAVQVMCSGLATRDDRDEFVGADIILTPTPKDAGRPPTSGFETVQPHINTQETDYLKTYFVLQLEGLYKLCMNWGGKRIASRLEKIINETGQRNVWSINMSKGKVSVELKQSDIDMYRALMARALNYVAQILGNGQVVKEMEFINSKTPVPIMNFVQTLSLDTLYVDILK